MADLSVYIPTPGSPLSRHLVPGSAVVVLTTPNSGAVTIYYEGNKNGAQNLGTFISKLASAAGRLMTNYPTVATMSVGRNELVKVGSYHYDFKLLQIDRPDLVEAWEKGRGIYDCGLKSPGHIRLTLDVDYELNGVSLGDLKILLREVLEREIGNGALTAKTAAEVDSWKIRVE